MEWIKKIYNISLGALVGWTIMLFLAVLGSILNVIILSAFGIEELVFDWCQTHFKLIARILTICGILIGGFAGSRCKDE